MKTPYAPNLLCLRCVQLEVTSYEDECFRFVCHHCGNVHVLAFDAAPQHEVSEVFP